MKTGCGVSVAFVELLLLVPFESVTRYAGLKIPLGTNAGPCETGFNTSNGVIRKQRLPNPSQNRMLFFVYMRGPRVLQTVRGQTNGKKTHSGHIRCLRSELPRQVAY